MLLYSARFRRRRVTRPGLPILTSELDFISTHSAIRCRAVSEGCGRPAGGIVCWVRRLETLPQISSVLPKSVDCEAAARSNPADACGPEWHPRQYLATTGLTSTAKLAGVFAVGLFWPALSRQARTNRPPDAPKPTKALMR